MLSDISNKSKHLKNNDTDSFFRDMYYDVKSCNQEIITINNHTQVIDDISIIDAFENRSYDLDKNLDFMDATSNFKWKSRRCRK